jgi:hypothetical protein
MAYIQKNNPIPRTGCGRRRAEQMTNPFKKLKPCQKAAAKRKFDVYPSAYANMWASNHKC